MKLSSQDLRLSRWPRILPRCISLSISILNISPTLKPLQFHSPSSLLYTHTSPSPHSSFYSLSVAASATGLALALPTFVGLSRSPGTSIRYPAEHAQGRVRTYPHRPNGLDVPRSSIKLALDDGGIERWKSLARHVIDTSEATPYPSTAVRRPVGTTQEEVSLWSRRGACGRTRR